MNLSEAIVIGSAFVAVGIFVGLKAISDALYALWNLLYDLSININHYTKSEEEGGAE